MKRMSLDRRATSIRDFVRSLRIGPEGLLLEIQGRALLRVLPPVEDTVDRKKLKQAILRRRDASRVLNEGWAAVDRETWGGVPE